MVARVQNFSARMPIPVSDRSPLPEVGATVHLNRLETFRGFANGPMTICGAYYDHFGAPFVNLARDGQIFVSGVSWPMGGKHVERFDSTCHDSNRDTEVPSGIGEANVAKRGDATQSGGVDRDDRLSDPSTVAGVESLVGCDDQGTGGAIRASSPREFQEPGRDCGTRPGDREGDLRQPLTCGIVVIVDLMNLLVRAWHAGKATRTHAVNSLLLTTANIVERLSPEYMLFAGEGGHAERTRLYPAYKAHRPPSPPGLREQIDMAYEAIESMGWPVIRAIDWEADDVIASLAMRLAPVAGGVLIASSDKDLLQLVGTSGIMVYHPWDGGKKIRPDDVRSKFGIDASRVADYLAIVGDSSDGIPGVKGIGAKGAVDLLTEYGSLEKILEESRAKRIAGKLGKLLEADRDSAVLSRQLVELNKSIEVPDSWRDWPAASPRAGWRDRLQRLDLSQVARRFDGLFVGPGVVRQGAAAIRIDAIPEHGCTAPPSVSDDQDWIETMPELAKLPPGSSEIDSARSVYASSYRRRHDETRVNPWRPGTLFFDACNQGKNGEPFSVRTDSVEAAAKTETSPATAKKTLSLF